jgi:hypothetical protein
MLWSLRDLLPARHGWNWTKDGANEVVKEVCDIDGEKHKVIVREIALGRDAWSRRFTKDR